MKITISEESINFSSEEAIKLSNNKLQEKINKKVNEIIGLIKVACNKGEFIIYLNDEILDKEVKKILEESGYKIECVGRYNENYTMIKWGI